ncbi:MAG TPA: type II toxin-antitoxin system VapC family toxin [Arsenicitalea sp.]|jgi:tRNA(fMet)-specific endonuclease VapC|nr:type II toxin-antitoxin system VapC family toxin [Arsenicitalea sp.]
MLDTNIVSDLVRNPAGRAAQKLADFGDQGICISIVTAAELRFGIAKRGSERLAQQVEAVLSAIDILPLDAPADTEYGAIRLELEQLGTPIGPNDLLIAAHAKAVGVPLATANVAEFGRVRGLSIVNWLD